MYEKPTYEELKKRVETLEKRNAELKANEIYSWLFELSPYGIFVVDENNDIVDVNQCACRMLDYTREELLHLNARSVIHPEDLAQLPIFTRNDILESPTNVVVERRYRKRNGVYITVEISVKAIEMTSRYFVIFRDISAQKQTKHAMIESEKKYRTLFEKAGDAIFIMKAEGKDSGQIIDANIAAAQMHGYTLEEMLSMNIKDLDTDKVANEAPHRMQKMLDGHWIQSEIMHRKKNGSPFPVEISAGMIELSGEKYFLAFDRDITDRKRSERKLKESEERYRTIFEGAGEGLLVTDLKTMTVEFANPAMCDFLGYDPEHLCSMNVSDLHPPKYLIKMMKEFRSPAKGNKHLSRDIPCLRSDGNVVYADVRTAIIELDGRQCILGFFADISEQKQVWEALQEQLLFFQTLIDTIPSPIFYKDETGRYLGCNSAFESFIGLKKDELIGKTVYDIALKPFADTYHEADVRLLKSKGVQIYETKVKDSQGSLHDVIFNNAVFPKKDNPVGGLVGVMVDITERKQVDKEKKAIEMQLRQTQKMEAIGMLAGGIAHDFNNILSGIMGYTQLVMRNVETGTKPHTYLEKIFTAGKRATDLIKQIQAFSQQTEEGFKPVKLQQVVIEALKLIRATLPSSIEIMIILNLCSFTMLFLSSERPVSIPNESV